MEATDPYAAWCLDQAIAVYISRLNNKEKLRPEKTENNDDLLRQFLGGGKHGGS